VSGAARRRAVISAGESLQGSGGVARVALAQAAMLRECGFEPVAVTPDAVSKPWTSRRFPALNVALLSWQVSHCARQATAGRAPLFSHGMCGARGGEGMRVQLHHGTFRGLAHACRARLSRLEYLILHTINGILERSSSRTRTNVCVSAPVVGELERLYGIRGGRVIYNPVDGEHFAAAAGESRPDRRDAFTGLCVGRMDYGKGRETVRKMGELLPSEYRLELAAPHIQGEAAWPGDRMRALGRVEYADLPAVYRNSDYLLVASRYEGFGLTMIEAWASGRPIISTNVGLASELRGTEPALDALVVDDPDDADAFAERVRLLRENPELGRRQVEWGRQLIAERFALTAYRRAWRELLSEIGLLN
jgi:glycosyltransferase involved in cell wall biosynthesis